MSELAIRRSKIARQINQLQKINYFKTRRDELLASFQDDNEEYEYTSPETNWLKETVFRSIKNDQLLQDIERNSLIKTLQHIAFSTIKGRDIEFILMILSNVLLDRISLDTKEQIVKLCLQCFELKPFKDYSFSNTSLNLSNMRSIVHVMNSLAGTITKIDQQLGVKCQELIMRQLIKVLWQIKDCLKNLQQEDQQYITSSISLTSMTIKRLIGRQKEYANEIYSLVQRNLSSFVQILKLHADIVFKNGFNNLVKHIHYEMLSIEHYLVTILPVSNFQIYFQSNQLISIILKEIYENRDEKLNRLALQLFYNLLKQYENNQILLLLSMIENDVHLKDKFTFFKKLFYNDALRKQRMLIIQFFITTDEAYTLIQPFFQQFWKEIFDGCYYLIKEMVNQSMECGLNILLCCKDKKFSNYQYQPYLRSIGLQGLLEYLFSYDVTKRCELQQDIQEVVRQKVGVMLDFLQIE